MKLCDLWNLVFLICLLILTVTLSFRCYMIGKVSLFSSESVNWCSILHSECSGTGNAFIGFHCNGVFNFMGSSFLLCFWNIVNCMAHRMLKVMMWMRVLLGPCLFHLYLLWPYLLCAWRSVLCVLCTFYLLIVCGKMCNYLSWISIKNILFPEHCSFYFKLFFKFS